MMAGEDQNPYAGRWIARVRGRVVAQGGTPEQARRAAQGIRFKETPDIVYMPTDQPLTLSPLLESVRSALPDTQTAFLVGGAVRDALLGRLSHDLDFALRTDGIKTARRIANVLKADFYPLDPERDTGRVIVTGPDEARTFMDFATYRGPDLEADLAGRDFTINAIAMDLHTGALHDPLDGISDLKEKRMRACLPTTFMDDPVRILRGIRLAVAFGFRILPETRTAMRMATGRLNDNSPERLRDELFRILEGPHPDVCLRALQKLGVFKHFLPELDDLAGVSQSSPHVSDVWSHTLSTLAHLESILQVLAPQFEPDRAADVFNGLLALRLGRYRAQLAEHLGRPLNVNRSLRGLLFLAALYHDIAKPACRSVEENGQIRFLGHDAKGADIAAERARQLSLSKDEVERLSLVIRHHMRIHYLSDGLIRENRKPTRRAIYRFFKDAGQAGIDLLLLGLADCRATYEHTLPQATWAAYLDVCRELMENWWERRQESISPPPVVNGDDLMRAFHLQPGPQIAELLESIREAQATGRVSNRSQALGHARQLVKKGKQE